MTDTPSPRGRKTSTADASSDTPKPARPMRRKIGKAPELAAGYGNTPATDAPATKPRRSRAKRKPLGKLTRGIRSVLLGEVSRRALMLAMPKT